MRIKKEICTKFSEHQKICFYYEGCQTLEQVSEIGCRVEVLKAQQDKVLANLLEQGSWTQVSDLKRTLSIPTIYSQYFNVFVLLRQISALR